MNKREAIWLLIRLVGLWFFWQALESALAIVGNYLLASQTPGLLSRSGGVFLQITVRMVIYLALSFYCLGAGNMICYLLSREPGVEDQEEPHRRGTLL